jgi:hypothetical protein
MRTALCLSGQSRSYKKSIKSLKKEIIDKYDCDVFIHTWRDGGKKVGNEYIKDFEKSQWVEEIDYSFIKEYNPKKIKIDYTDYNKFYKKTPLSRFYNTLMMWYSIYQSNNLKKEYEKEFGIKYDCVIRCRFDLYFEKFEITELKSNTIYLPPNENIDNPFTTEMKEMLKIMGPRYMPNDQFAYGNSESMDYYSSVHELLDKDTNSFCHHSEGLVTEHLWLKNKTDIVPIINDLIRMKIQR